MTLNKDDFYEKLDSYSSKDFNANLGADPSDYNSYCAFRLPCGICSKTNKVCGIKENNINH